MHVVVCFLRWSYTCLSLCCAFSRCVWWKVHVSHSVQVINASLQSSLWHIQRHYFSPFGTVWMGLELVHRCALRGWEYTLPVHTNIDTCGSWGIMLFQVKSADEISVFLDSKLHETGPAWFSFWMWLTMVIGNSACLPTLTVQANSGVSWPPQCLCIICWNDSGMICVANAATDWRRRKKHSQLEPFENRCYQIIACYQVLWNHQTLQTLQTLDSNI